MYTDCSHLIPSSVGTRFFERRTKIHCKFVVRVTERTSVEVRPMMTMWLDTFSLGLGHGTHDSACVCSPTKRECTRCFPEIVIYVLADSITANIPACDCSHESDCCGRSRCASKSSLAHMINPHTLLFLFLYSCIITMSLGMECMELCQHPL
jgi:hypothetical protein